MKTIFVIVLSILMCGSMTSCQNASSNQKQQSSPVNSEPIETSSMPSDTTNEMVPNHYTKQDLTDIGFENSTLLSFHKTLYGKEIDYLGHTTTQDGHDQIYIQSRKRLNVNERWESWEMGQHFYADLVALDVHSNGELWSVEDTCQELWTYRIHGTTIASVAFDSSFVYVGTSYGPDQNYGEYHILCLDKKTGKERWKQTITGAVSSELVLYDSFLFFETQNYDKTYLYALQSRTGSVVESLSTPFRSFIHLNDQLCYTSIEDSKLYLHMFSLKERTFQSHVWEELGDIEWQDTEGLVKMDSLVGYALLIKNENDIESSLDDTNETKSIIRLFTYNVEKREPAWNTTIETGKSFSFFQDCNYANSVLYINTWGNNGCIAFDTMTKIVKWETWIEEYALEQLNVYFGNIYVVVAPLSSGRDYIKHAQTVLELTPETGKILGTTPESRYTGIARIVGTYRNNLITQGPDNAFLEFYPVK